MIKTSTDDELLYLLYRSGECLYLIHNVHSEARMIIYRSGECLYLMHNVHSMTRMIIGPVHYISAFVQGGTLDFIIYLAQLCAGINRYMYMY